jgi:hypothetical protein
MVLVPSKTLDRKEMCASMSRDDALRMYAEQFDEVFIGRARDAVLDRLSAVDSLKDLRSWILNEVVDTPATYADKYNVGAGTPFALSHGLAQLLIQCALLRSQHKTRQRCPPGIDRGQACGGNESLQNKNHESSPSIGHGRSCCSKLK